MNMKIAAIAAYLLSGAQERTRTSTPLLALGPEPSASTNSATWAGKGRKNKGKQAVCQ
jgi:hypothetical protein